MAERTRGVEDLTNTGLQAGDYHRCASLAVLTASFIVPTQSVTINELSQFFCESAHTMMFFLFCDVPRYRVDVGMRYGESTVSPAPGKFSRNNVV